MDSSDSDQPGAKSEGPAGLPCERLRDVPNVVVGVGASAGGLEALTELLANLPDNTGMAFVVVQHLDPQHVSMLGTLLSRVTHLPVLEATHDLAVRPDHVYIIPKNTTMTIVRGLLQLAPRGGSRVLHLPIDVFLKSLAADRQTAAIGVILSGTGSDGTVGMEEIKAAGGITFAQDESSARYPGMPQSAAQSGCVDLVLPPKQIARELARIGQHPYVIPNQPVEEETGPVAPDDEHFNKVLGILRSTFRVDFSGYRETTVRRRIHRRMVLLTRDNLADYIELLKSDRAEVEALYQDILINVTSFFREPEVFEALKQSAFPEILKTKGPDTPIRLWVPGCSTGQEAYSLAMVLLEFLETQPVRPPINIFATDLSESGSLVKAREGVYSDSIAAEVSPERLRRFFTREPGSYRINKSIRDLCVFARQNVVVDPPFSRLDLISCRNVLIYLKPALQKRVIPTFHYALNPVGFLVLGASETVGPFSTLFGAADASSRIYVKKAAGLRQYPHFQREDTAAAETAGASITSSSALPADWQRAADRIVVGEYVPPGVLVNDGLDILQFRGRAGDYLEHPPGEPDHNLLKMAREGLLLPLRTALNECRETNAPVRKAGVPIGGAGAIRKTDLRVFPVRLPNSGERCFLVLFEEPGHEPSAPRSAAATGPAGPLRWLPSWLRHAVSPAAAVAPTSQDEGGDGRLRQDLAEMRDYLQSVTEQQDAVNEELKSANEEILSSNEELRSTNEELETAKEELQSVNEELVTVNEQLMIRNRELTRVSDDLANLLSSANVPIVALGVDLRIRWFTPAAGRVLRLLIADVGRPIGGLKPVLDSPDLEALITGVIDSVQTVEREVRDRDGHWHLLRIRPYRTAENKIDGAVVVLADIDEVKRAELSLKETSDYAQSIVDTVREPLLILGDDLRVKSANESFYRTFRVMREETENLLLYELGKGQWDIPALRALLEDVLPGNQAFEAFEVEHVFPGIGHRVMLLNARQLRPSEGAPHSILLAFQDVTEHRRAEAALWESLERYRFLTESMPLVIFTARPDGNVDHFNRHWCEFTGLSTASSENLDWGRFVHPSDMEETERRWRHAIDTGEPFQLEHRFRRTDGAYHWHLSRANSLRDAEGNVLIWTGSSTDIEDQKRSENALKEADRYKDEFLANMSHEIRTPMNGVIGATDLLQATGLTPEQRDLVQTARDSGTALLSLINDILDYSKIEAGRLAIEPSPFNLRRLGQEAVEVVAPGAFAKGLQPIVAIPPGMHLYYSGDAGRIRQVLLNFLSNAIKFTPRGGDVVLSASAEPAGDRVARVRLAVRDTGIGVPPDRRDAIFERFTQADTGIARAYGGTGLGLAICQRLAVLMGGSVGLDSGPGRGSTFWLELDLPVCPEPGDRRPDVGALSGCRVLVADGSPTVRATLCDQLRSWGASPLEAADAADVIALLRSPGCEDPIAAVLLDGQLPGAGACELAGTLAADRRTASVPRVLLCTGALAIEDWKQSGHFTAALAKPVRPSSLYDTFVTIFQGASPADGRQAEVALPAERFHGTRVLLVEDNPTNRKVTLLMLERFGCMADAAGDGREALELLSRIRYDLVFMDVQMPGMDGLEATAEIRRREATAGGARHTVIAMTASALRGDRERCLATGMDDYLPKPVTLDGMAGMLEKWRPAAPHRAGEPAVAGNAGPSSFEPDRLGEITGGDPALESKLIACFVSDAAELLARIRTALDSADARQVHKSAHELHGMCRTFGVPVLGDTARGIERATLGGDLTGVVDSLDLASRQFAEVRAILTGRLEASPAACPPPADGGL